MRTHTSVIFLVIALLGIMAVICIGSLCYCAIAGVQVQESLLTALIGLAGSLSGAIGATLVNTRNQPTEPGISIVANSKPEEPIAQGADK